MRKLQSFFATISKILRDLKTQGSTYLQGLGRSQSAQVNDEPDWETGDEMPERKPIY